MPETNAPAVTPLIQIRVEQGRAKRWRWYGVDKETQKTLFANGNPRGFSSRQQAESNATACMRKVAQPYEDTLTEHFEERGRQDRASAAAEIGKKDGAIKALRERLEMANARTDSIKRQCEAWARKRAFWYRWGICASLAAIAVFLLWSWDHWRLRDLCGC